MRSTQQMVDHSREEQTPDDDPPARTVTVALPAPKLAEADIELAPGEKIGRYVIIEKIGAGGMGVVFKAMDPDLDRLLAIKVLRPGVQINNHEGRARLLREGQAIAQLAHPNVVSVHDFGEWRDSLFFVAMEYVEGCSLKMWLRERPRTLREIVAIFVQAGRGLSAAHAKGLVHRDFKPDNVLIGNDGRVRVVDFGLAKAEVDAGDAAADHDEPAADTDSSDRIPHRLSSQLNAQLTEIGRVVGTPAYMAPEQFRGRPGDARSDQFAFCVVLYSALAQQRPFLTLPRFPRSDGEVAPARPMPSSARVPRWLERLVMRGLSLRAADRFPSMAELLAELERDRGKRRRWALVGSAVVAALAIGAVARSAFSSQETPTCAGAGAGFAQVWNAGVRARVHASFLATKRPYAESTFVIVSGLLDRYAADWAATATSSCEATHVRGIQSEHHLDLRTACLSRRVSEVTALVDVYARDLDGEHLDRAIAAAHGLEPLTSCSGEAVLAEGVPLPADPVQQRRIEELRRQLDQANALAKMARYKEGSAIAERARQDAGTLDYLPLRAEANLALANIQQRDGKPKAAEESLRASLAAASSAKDAALVSKALQDLVWVVGYRQARYDEGFAYYVAADSVMKLAPEDDIRRAILLNQVGVLFYLQNRHREAMAYHQQALAILERARGSNRILLGNVYNNLGNAVGALGNPEEALRYYDKDLAISRELLGPDHPDTLISMANVANTLGDLGRFDDARAHIEYVIAKTEESLGKDHMELALSVAVLGDLYAEQGRFADAKPHLERALRIAAAVYEPNDPIRVEIEVAHARCQMELGMVDEALAVLEPLVERAGSDAGEANIAERKFYLAQALWKQGNDRARALRIATPLGKAWVGKPGRWSRKLVQLRAWLDERGVHAE